MGDLALAQDKVTGKSDFQAANGDLVVTDLPWPSIMRLLLQGAWIADDGERTGDSLNDVTLSTYQTKERVARIAQIRLGALIRTGEITAVDVLDVFTTPQGKLFALIQVAIPGSAPKTIQVPLT